MNAIFATLSDISTTAGSGQSIGPCHQNSAISLLIKTNDNAVVSVTSCPKRTASRSRSGSSESA